MKREDKTTKPDTKSKTRFLKNSQSESSEAEEKLFTLGQVQSLVILVTAGVMGIGGQECVEDAEKLPKELKKVLITAIMAARECMMAQMPSMLASILAKAGKQRND